MSTTDDSAVRQRQSLRQVARETPERRVGVTHNWSTEVRVFHYLDGEDAACDTNIREMWRGTAAEAVDVGLGDCVECGNCLRPIQFRTPHEGGYADRDCPLCGESIPVLAKHLPGCEARNQEVNHVR